MLQQKKKLTRNKKKNLVEYLTKDSTTPKDRHSQNISTHSNKSIDDKNKIHNKMKDKIRNFVFEIEGVTTKTTNHSAKEFPRQSHKELIKYEYNTISVTTSNDHSVNGNKEYKTKNNYGKLNNYNGNFSKSPNAKEDKSPPNFFEIKKDISIYNNFS